MLSVLMTTEGTYPYGAGGVSTWCDALLRNTQFADFHGHGWMFRKVFKRDRKGNLLDAEGFDVLDQGLIDRPVPGHVCAVLS